MIKKWVQYSFRIPEIQRPITLRANITTRNFLHVRWRSDLFPNHSLLCTFLPGSKWWSQVSSTVRNLEIKLSGFSLNSLRKLANVSARSAFWFWTFDNMRGTVTPMHRHFFINKLSVKIKYSLPVEMPTDSTMKLKWHVGHSLIYDEFVVSR